MKEKEIIKLGELLQTKTQIEKMKYAKILKQQQSALNMAEHFRRLAKESNLDETERPTAIGLLHLEKYRSQLSASASRLFANADSLHLAIQSARAGLQKALQRELAWGKTARNFEREALKKRNNNDERQSEQAVLTKFNQAAKP